MAFRDISESDFAKNIKWETAGIDPTWVGHIYETEDGIPIVTFKDEYFAEVARATKKKLLEQGIIGADQIDPNVPKLPREQIDNLLQRYEPKHMELAAYKAFIEDLIQMGALSGNEKKYLLFSDTLVGPSGSAIVPETWMEPPYEFDSCRGNVYELARFHSQMELCVSDSCQHFQSAQSKAFGKLLNIMNQMGIR